MMSMPKIRGVNSMQKRFNTTGICVPRKHYMVDISGKLMQIKALIDRECYFTINKPRQYGKSTTLSCLSEYLKDQYLVIDISFEGIGDSVFENERDFCIKFIKLMVKALKFSNEEESLRLMKLGAGVNDLEETSEAITEFCRLASKEVILFVDEVDKNSNNQLFLSFIGMLRNKYLYREVGRDFTFKSVVLVGLYDVKSLKLKLRSDEEAKYNSPWNIAVNFDVDMSFSVAEICSIIQEYAIDNKLDMNTEEISREIYFFTSGYPYLVSKVCEIIDEKINCETKKAWSVDNVRQAIKMLNDEVSTLFESIIKNLENNKELYDITSRILIDGELVIFNALDPIISIGLTYGIFKKGREGLEISNKIFEEIIYNYMLSKIRTNTKNMSLYNVKQGFIKDNGELNIEKALTKFQNFMREQYSSKDIEFLETHI